MATHTGNKRHQCQYPGCSYASAQSTHLTEHMRTHTGEKPFACPVCQHGFARTWHVSRHIKLRHPEYTANSADLKAQQQRERETIVVTTTTVTTTTTTKTTETAAIAPDAAAATAEVASPAPATTIAYAVVVGDEVALPNKDSKSWPEQST
eukprot:SAG22_NODE_931_length_6450_cov_2.817981_6_plen_151_part_00